MIKDHKPSSNILLSAEEEFFGKIEKFETPKNLLPKKEEVLKQKNDFSVDFWKNRSEVKITKRIFFQVDIKGFPKLITIGITSRLFKSIQEAGRHRFIFCMFQNNCLDEIIKRGYSWGVTYSCRECALNGKREFMDEKVVEYFKTSLEESPL